MKRSLLAGLCVVLLSTCVRAQTNAVPDTTIEDKLVQLALEGPRYKGSEHKNKIDEYQLRKTKSQWLNLLSLSMNYNDQTFAKQQPNQAIVYPKYFFGFTVPLGIIFSNGIEVKAAREGIKASQTAQAQLAREIKKDVLTRYAQYRTYGELLGIQNKVVDDEEAAFRKAEKTFGDGTITIEAYNIASRNYNQELTKRLNLKLQQDLVKIEIEELIGTSLDALVSTYSVKQQ